MNHYSLFFFVSLIIGVSCPACSIYGQVNDVPALSNKLKQEQDKSSLLPSGSPHPHDSDMQDVAVVHLEFKKGDVVSGVKGSYAFTTPVVCSSNGIPYVSFLDPGSFGMQTIVSLDPKGGHYFSLSSVPEVYDVTLLRGFFASESLVGVLVNGTRDNAIKIPQSFPSDSGVKPRAIYTGVHHDYLVEFDVQGNYKKAIELPDSYHFWHFEALGNDDLLALGYDKINPGPQLFILDSSGQVKRNLQIPDRLVDDPVLYDGQSSDVTKQVVAETSMNWWNFALARNKVILYKARTNDPIVEIGSGGVARDISVDYPEGYVLDSIVPANDRWIVRFRKGAIEDAATSGKPIEATSYVLYEADPVDGTLLRQFEISGPFYSIACEHDGVISAFSVQEEKVSLLTAEIQR